MLCLHMVQHGYIPTCGKRETHTFTMEKICIQALLHKNSFFLKKLLNVFIIIIFSKEGFVHN